MAVRKRIERPEPKLVKELRDISPPTLHEAMGKRGAMPTPIKPLYAGMRVCGPALTVACPPGDNLVIHYAVTLAEPGDVLVVDYAGYTEAGPWGDVLTTAAQGRGVAGLVIDGCVRDALAIRAAGFPVFARGTNMKGTTKSLPGEVNQPILCAGVPVAPGDIVVGDDDGVVVVPKEHAGGVLAAAREREAKEEQLRERLRAGKTTVELLNLTGALRSAGIA